MQYMLVNSNIKAVYSDLHHLVKINYTSLTYLVSGLAPSLGSVRQPQHTHWRGQAGKEGGGGLIAATYTG